MEGRPLFRWIPYLKDLWRKPGSRLPNSPPDRANKEMIVMGKNQPDLFAFLMAYTDHLLTI